MCIINYSGTHFRNFMSETKCSHAIFINLSMKITQFSIQGIPFLEDLIRQVKRQPRKHVNKTSTCSFRTDTNRILSYYSTVIVDVVDSFYSQTSFLLLFQVNISVLVALIQRKNTINWQPYHGKV